MHATVPTVRIKAAHPSQGAFVEINASDFNAAKHERYDAPLAPPPVSTVALPPPPLPVDPFANLPRNWREWKPQALRELAEKADGRTPENREQAIAVIEARLAKK